jgi:hypothetical protein
VDVRQLLWRLAEKYTRRSSTVRPDWFDHAGDLVVADGRVIWETPWHTEGGFTHALPAGSHPVHVGAYAHIADRWNPDGFRYFASMVVIPLAEPARIAEADWEVHGYDDIHLIEDYAVLWGDDAQRTTYPYEDDVPSFFPAVRDRIMAKGPHYRRDNWANVVLDRETGLNGIVLPVEAECLSGYEIVDGEGNLLCVVLTTFD